MRDASGREWLPLAEAAALLGVPPARIRKRIQRGKVRSYLVGGVRWVCVTDVARRFMRGRPTRKQTPHELD